MVDKTLSSVDLEGWIYDVSVLEVITWYNSNKLSVGHRKCLIETHFNTCDILRARGIF